MADHLLSLKIVDSGLLGAKKQMDEDARLLQSLEERPETTLRFYQFPSQACTHGLFMDPYPFFDWKAVENLGMEIAKRPTGGGLIFHAVDFTFSVLMPAAHPLFPENVIESYRLINSHALEAIQEAFGVTPELAENAAKEASPRSGFCLAKATVYDLMLSGKKIGGAAQRRTRSGLLHQASITLGLPEEDALKNLLPNHPEIVSSMLKNSAALIAGPLQESAALEQCRQSLKRALARSFAGLNLSKK